MALFNFHSRVIPILPPMKLKHASREKSNLAFGRHDVDAERLTLKLTEKVYFSNFQFRFPSTPLLHFASHPHDGIYSMEGMEEISTIFNFHNT